jgi:hypothetical protein
MDIDEAGRVALTMVCQALADHLLHTFKPLLTAFQHPKPSTIDKERPSISMLDGRLSPRFVLIE